jgi:uncharacterized protein YdeI (YjbR/CyaY-like superfamily)
MKFQPTSRAAWRAWLDEHHATATEISVVFYRKAAGKPTITYDEAVEEALCFGWIDGIKHKLDGQRYTYRFTPRREGSVWSEINRARLEQLAAAGKIHAAGQAAIDRAKQSGAWHKPARSPVPDAMPAELERAFAQSPKARAAYDALALSHRRGWQRWIHEAKQAQTRERRAQQAAKLLAAHEPHPWLPKSKKK